MKKYVWLMGILSMLLGGCSTITSGDSTLEGLKDQKSIVEEQPEDEGDNLEEETIEENVNDIDIQDDRNLTERAEDNNKTEEEQLLDQNEVQKQVKENNEGTAIDQKTAPTVSYKVYKTFDNKVPETMNVALRYDKYPVSYNYFVVLGANINIRETPSTSSSVLKKAMIFEKLNLIEEVQGQYLEKYNSDIWYRVFWKEGEAVKEGYVYGRLGDSREFQFEKMEKAINDLKDFIDHHAMGYIANYKNRAGMAPLYNGKSVDAYGSLRDQSAPGYTNGDQPTDFRYFGDGMVVGILDENDRFYKVSSINFEGEYWIPKKYISFKNQIISLKKVIVVDRKNQNEGTFEYGENGWDLVSNTLVTTGVKAEYKFETPLGYYMAIEKKSKFLYLDDVTKKIAGYAPYAVRFTGGAYTHGVPVDYIIQDGKLVDPGHKEYLLTIGTEPRSHKCVRNYTSHAKFLYEWIDIGESAVIVIE